MPHPLLDHDAVELAPEEYLRSVGTVFAEFGPLTQDSGNVSYGVQIGEERYFVYTRWDSEESFQNWVNSQAFTHGHAKAESSDGKPVSTGAHLLAFEVVQHVTKDG